MEKSIALHPKLGVNPRMTFCPQCRKDGQDILFLGDNNEVYVCESCDMHHIGKAKRNKCPCGGTLRYERELRESERLPGSICDECKAKNQEMEKMVAEGGVHWQCADCGSAGAIKGSNQLAKAVREQSGIEAPAPVGVEFSRAECPVCQEGGAA